MIFACWQDAVVWSVEQLACQLKAQIYDRDSIAYQSYGKGNAYLDALEIKTQYDEAARMFMAEDDRGNWILLRVLALDEPVRFRPYELRRIERAIEFLKESLERTGFIIS